ncbi:MAG: hypothetical protein VR72_21395 [Clostridiaceae bacterium BRH_c20a]|nr:MAG: hypothetical protein VR72_21395 [Clostridiaceae bacterium BRH_c20a]
MNNKLSRVILLLLIVLSFISINACTKGPSPLKEAPATEESLVLATTTSTEDSGLLDILIPAFEKEYNTQVKVIAVGSGQAMEMGKKGDADALLVHSPAAEDQFMAEGWGKVRKDVMYNQFLIVGPASDPAGISGMADAVAALKKLAETNSKFISRADKSGTHSKELSIWKAAEVTPAGSWYIESGQGMGDTLMMAVEMNAYTLIDEATFLSFKNKTIGFQVVVEGDKLLFNPYGAIAVSPEKYPNIGFKAAEAFVNFIAEGEGQSIIADFGKETYGKNLFTPVNYHP